MEMLDPTQIWMLGIIAFGAVFFAAYKAYH